MRVWTRPANLAPSISLYLVNSACIPHHFTSSPPLARSDLRNDLRAAQHQRDREDDGEVSVADHVHVDRESLCCRRVAKEEGNKKEVPSRVSSLLPLLIHSSPTRTCSQ